MKFIISRASCWSDDQPCNEAVQEKLTFVDERHIDDPLKNSYIGQAWYTDEGYFNHRVENGHIKRDYYRNDWTITIDTLADLLALQDKYGHLILYNTTDCIECPREIKIYDDYVE